MRGAQSVNDVVEIHDILHPQLAIFAGSLFGPSRRREDAVHVPLEIPDLVFARELVEHAENMFRNVLASHVQHQLIAQLAAWTAWKIHDPVRVSAIQIAVGVDHLGLDPQSKIHAEVVHVIDQGREAVRKLLRVDEPIAQSGAIVVSLAEPAVVHDEKLDAELCSFIGELFLPRLVHGESRGLPRVIKDRPDTGLETMRRYFGALETVQETRSSAESVLRKAGVKSRCLKRFTGLQRIHEIKRIEADRKSTR